MADEGMHLVSHPEEVIATFFLSLPEPLGFPLGTLLPSYLNIGAAQMQVLTEAQLGFSVTPLSETGSARDAAPEQHDELLVAPDHYLADKVLLSSSCLVYQVTADLMARSGLDAAALVARIASSERFDLSELPALHTLDRPTPTSDEVEARVAEGVGDVTVLEVAVGLRLIGGLPDALPSPLPDNEGDRQADEYPQYPDLWHYKVHDATKPMPTSELRGRLFNALNVAVHDVQSIQRGYQAITRHPISVLTLERLPPYVPFVLRRFRDLGEAGHALHGMMEANRNYWSLLRPPLLKDKQLASINYARSRVERGAFSGYLDLHRDADVALRRQGDTRVAALLFGVAAEVLLDELLLHLQWEEGLTPEAAAATWVSGLSSRIKGEYARRVGGNWDPSGTGAVAQWSRITAATRHRVAHAGYTPTAIEAQESAETVALLVTYLCDRLARGTVISKYPLTALSLAGEQGLSRRNALTKRIRRIGAESVGDEVFARWREVHRRIRRDREQGIRAPNEEKSHLLAVVREDGTLRWCIHDRAAFMAAEAEVDAEFYAELEDGPLGELINQVRESAGESVSIAVEGNERSSARRIGEWLEEYRLVPLAGVMVDRSDLSR